MALEGPRVLAQVMTGSEISNSAAPPPAPITITSATGSWETVDGTTLVAVQRDYFDLSGYNEDRLTTFISGVEMQEPGPLDGDDENNQLLEIISTERITDEDIARFTTISGFSGPGFSMSVENMDQVVYGRRRLYTFDGAIVPIIPKLWHSSTWGTATGVTCDKLHLTRIVITSTLSSVTHVSDINVVLAVIVAKEDDLPFLMRQKRSYEMATGPS